MNILANRIPFYLTSVVIRFSLLTETKYKVGRAANKTAGLPHGGKVANATSKLHGPLDTVPCGGRFQNHSRLVKSRHQGAKVCLGKTFLPVSWPAGQSGPDKRKGFAALGKEAEKHARGKPLNEKHNVKGTKGQRVWKA